MPRLNLGDWVDSGVDWLVTHMSWLFDAIKAVVEGMYDAVNAVLTAPEPLLLAGILAVLAWWLRGLVPGVLAFAGFALVDSLELWDRAMSTLALVLVATVIALVISIPLGIWAARSKAVSAAVRPVLDLLQTMPSMVLLIPAILFFGLGTAAGVIATLIFALAPGVRMTELGIRQVDAELVEAAEAFGTAPRDTLLRVQLPLALPTIMAGINQVIMLSLSMVVIAGMVGTGGLGGAVNEAIGQLDIGFGFEAGVGIVVLAIYLDRVTGALGAQISPLGRRAAAKARAAGGVKVWNHRPRPVVAVAGVSVLALVAGGWASSAPPRAPPRPPPRTSARARRSSSATSPGTRASPPRSCGRSCWSAAASRSPPASTPPAPSTRASPPVRSTSRRTPGCPPRTPSTGRSTASSWRTSAPGTAPPPWSSASRRTSRASTPWRTSRTTPPSSRARSSASSRAPE